nr:hypothetical protein [Tanacetum cinerariifolium]
DYGAEESDLGLGNVVGSGKRGGKKWNEGFEGWRELLCIAKGLKVLVHLGLIVLTHTTHYGYNCPPKVPIIPDLEPFNTQTIKELPPTVQSFDPKSDLVHDSLNVFDPPLQLPLYSCEFCGNDARYGHYCTPQVPFLYPKPCYNQDFNFPQNAQNFQQQYLCCENCEKDEEKQIEKDQAANIRYWKIPAFYDDDDDDYTFAITPIEPDNSDHFDTVPATESDEFIKFSVENLVLIPLTISHFLTKTFKKIYLNLLFNEEIISMKIDQHHFNAEFDIIESLLNHDSSIISSLKINFLFDEFADELTLLKSIPPGIDETNCDPEEETRFIMRLLYDNSSSRLPEEFVYANSDAEIESFSPSPIPVEDSDSLMKEIDLSFTPDYPMPLGIEEDDYNSKRDILILEELLSNDSLLGISF